MVKTFVNIITRQKKNIRFFGDIFTHFVGPSPSFFIATGSQPSRPSSSSPTNGFVGNTLMFSLTQRFDEKQCAYIYSVISVKNLIVKVMFKKNKRRRRKSMYSDYASGIAFLIKNQLFNQRLMPRPTILCVWSSCLSGGAVPRPLVEGSWDFDGGI